MYLFLSSVTVCASSFPSIFVLLDHRKFKHKKKPLGFNYSLSFIDCHFNINNTDFFFFLRCVHLCRSLLWSGVLHAAGLRLLTGRRDHSRTQSMARQQQQFGLRFKCAWARQSRLPERPEGNSAVPWARDTLRQQYRRAVWDTARPPSLHWCLLNV